MVRRSPAASDRPLPARVSAELEVVDLATIRTGEWDQVELVGELPDGFDEPLLLTESRIAGASLVGAHLEGARLVDVAIHSADLSGADLTNCSLTRVDVRGSRLSGAQLVEARIRDVHVVDCRMDGANLRTSVAERLRLERCRLDAADFSAGRFEGVAWWDCDLTDADFTQASVSRAQLHGSIVDGLRGAGSLAPISIDADQAALFAAHVLAAMGIAVTPRDES